MGGRTGIDDVTLLSPIPDDATRPTFMTGSRHIAATCAAAVLLAMGAISPASSQTLCSAPIAPFCIDAAMTYEDPGTTERCRQDLETFAAQVEDYAACLEQQVEELRAEQKVIEDRFTCRSDDAVECTGTDALP